MSLAERIFPKQVAAAKQAAAQETADHLGRQYAQNITDIKNYVTRATIPGMWGNWSRSNGGKWPGGSSTPLEGVTFNNWQVRQFARDVYEDSVEARAMVERWSDTVVDSGLMLDPEPDTDILGLSEEQAEAWRSTVRTSFHLWASSKRQNRSGYFTFYQTQRLLQTYEERDNDTFLRLYYSTTDKKLLNPLQFEIIDTNQIRGDAILSTWMIGRYPDGIIRNPDGTEKTYQIWVQAENTMQFTSVDIEKYTPTGLTQMLHGFTPSYAGQGRGLSGLGIALQEFEMLTDFTHANVMKAINQSNLALFNKPSKDAPASNPYDQVGQIPAGPAAFQVGAPGSVPAATAAAVTATPTINMTPVMEATLNVPGSTALFNLDSGEELVPFTNTAPVVGYKEFVETFLSFLCASRGMPIEVLLMKFSNNYSASRATLLLFWRLACMKRDHLADNFLNPVYEMWLTCEVASGRISCPGWADPRLRAAWMAARWNGTPMPNIDPNATAKADQMYLEMGAQTPDDIARNLNGSNGKSNRQKNKAQLAELRDQGPMPWAAPAFGAPQESQQPDPQKTE